MNPEEPEDVEPTAMSPKFSLLGINEMVGPPLPENSTVVCVPSDAVIDAVADRSPTTLGVKTTNSSQTSLAVRVKTLPDIGPGH
jgi:hypothetical protein